MIISAGSIQVSLPLRNVIDEDGMWVSAADAAMILGGQHPGSFVGSTSEKRQFTIEGGEQLYVKFAFFVRSAFASNRPGASIIVDDIIRQLESAMVSSQLPQSPAPAQLPQLPASQTRQTRFGRQPFLSVIAQMGIGRDRAKELMDSLTIEGVPPIASTFYGQILGEATVKDATAIRAAVWLKRPISELFTTWRRGDVRFTGMERRVDDDVIMRVLSEAGVPHVA